MHTEGRDVAVTWMNSTANGKPVVPRTGYIVEFNALWYNALRFMASLARDDESLATKETDRKRFAKDAEHLEAMAEKCKQ